MCSREIGASICRGTPYKGRAEGPTRWSPTTGKCSCGCYKLPNLYRLSRLVGIP